MIKVFFKDKTVISLALVISFLLLFVSSLVSPVFVSAVSSLYITQGFTNINSFSLYEQQFLNSYVFPSNSFQVISNRPGVNGGILSFNLSSMHNWGTVSLQDQSYYLYVNRVSRSSSVDYMPDYIDYHGDILSLESQTFFVALPLGNYDFAYLHNFSSDFLNGSNGYLDQYSDSDIVFWGVANGNYDCRAKSFNTHYVVNSFEPDYSGPLIGFPVGLDFSVSDFMQWLVDNDKISVSADSGGVSVGGKIPAYIGISKLQSFLEFYKQFGSSNSSFISRIGSWFSYMNIVNQSNDNIVILKSTIDSLYREYINSYKHEFYSNSANQAHHRRNVNTQTTDDDLTLVTDTVDDDIYTSLLREIIRGIVALQSSIVSGLRAVIDTLNNLDFSVNVANNGGTGFDVNSIWGTGDITQSENYLALTNAFMDKGVDVSAAENMKINYLDNATQQDSFTVSVVMPDQYVNGQFTEKTVTHTIDNTSKMFNTLILFRKLIAFAVIAYFAIRIRFELPHLIRGE